MITKKYVYPKLPAVKNTPFFRIGGTGIANGLFVYAKAIVEAKISNAQIIAPTWFNFSLGTYLRHQRDKRHYLGLFKSTDEVSGLKRIILLFFGKRSSDANLNDGKVHVVEGIYDFFVPLIEHHKYVSEYIMKHINPKILKDVNSFDFKGCIAVHIRLGDFPLERRIPMDWYCKQIAEYGKGKKVLVFSDGQDEELSEILEINGVERAFFGGAIQDIVAMSRCEFIVGSNSSFSAWAAFLGQVPCSFYKLQFGKVLLDSNKQRIEIS